jgi:hypothetical protein
VSSRLTQGLVTVTPLCISRWWCSPLYLPTSRGPCTRLPRISQHCPASFLVLERCLRLIRAMRRCVPAFLKTLPLQVHCLMARPRSPGPPNTLMSPFMDRYVHPNRDINHTLANEVQYSTCGRGVTRPTRPRRYRSH